MAKFAVRYWGGFAGVAVIASVMTSGAAQPPTDASVQSAIQAAIDATTASAAGLSQADAIAAFKAAIQAAIAKTGARPRVVRAALAKVTCPGVCATALTSVQVQVVQLADVESRNEKVLSIGTSPLTLSTAFTAGSFNATPTASSSAGGGGSGYR